jgi:hypothetical protein
MTRNSQPQNIRTIEPQNDEVQTWNPDSILLPSAVLRFDILRFAVSENAGIVT